VEQDISTRLAQVEAQLAIQQLACRYARAVDARDVDGLIEVFSPNVDFGPRGKGEAGVRYFFSEGPSMRAFYRSMHQICGHVIDLIDTDHAKGTVYCRAEHEVGDKWIVQLIIYFDRYERIEGRWRIAGRAPRWLHTSDMGDHPQAVGFNDWPDRPDTAHFGPHVPQGFKTFQDYWAQYPEERALRTRLP
jgi:hypothetical protein